MRNENAEIMRVEQGPASIARRLDFFEMIPAFLAHQDVRPITKEFYRKGLSRFADWLMKNGIAQPDIQTLLQYKTFLQETGLAANTINGYLIAVRRFFVFLESSRLYPNIAKGLKGMKQPSGHLRETPTLAQAREILSKINTKSLAGKRDFAMINLMLRTGLRTVELTRADIEDLRQESGEALLFVQGKGRDSKDRFVLLTEETLRPIHAYLKARGKVDQEDPLFVSHSDRNQGERLTTRTVRGVSKLFLREIGLDNKRLSAHSFRHFFATQSLRAGAPLLQVQESMRHSSIETTQRYLHNLDRIEHAAEKYIVF